MGHCGAIWAMLRMENVDESGVVAMTLLACMVSVVVKWLPF